MRKTWAPRGQTPILRHRYSRERLSAISALTVSPFRQRLALYFQLHPHNLRSAQVVAFLRVLLRHQRGPVLLLWDTSPTHKSRVTEQFLARQRRLHVEPFPAYAPELNPDEQVWTQLKRAVANGTPDGLAELETMLHRVLGRLQRCPTLLRSCLHASELPWPR